MFDLHTLKELRDFINLLDRLNPRKAYADTSPHKYILLLAICRLIEEEPLIQNRFEYNDELENVFNDVWKETVSGQKPGFLEYPYYHLVSSGIWFHSIRIGKEDAYKEFTRFTPKRIFDTIEYSYLHPTLFRLLQEQVNRGHFVQMVKEKVSAIMGALEVDQTENPGAVAGVINWIPHEFRAIKDITDALGRYIELIPNYFVNDPATNQYHECDLIAVCQERMAIIELKHWAGEIGVYPHSWVINKKFHRRDPHISNAFKCKLLKALYLRSFPTLPELWVESIIVLTNEEATVHNAHSHKTDQHNLTFAGVDVLIKHLNHRIGGLSQIPEQKKLKTFQIKQVADLLRNQAKPHPKQRLNIPGYEIVEDLTHAKERLEFLIRPLEKRLHTIKRARIFCVDLTASSEIRKRERIKALNNLGALERISDHPNILRVWQIPNDEGLVIEASDWSQEGTLADAIRQKNSFSFEEACAIIQGVLEGLWAIHSESVIHRDLNPGNILISKGIPKLLNFDLSYYLEEDRITVLPETSSLKPSPYMAPEIYRRGSLTEAADLFSVGVILYEMLSGELPFKFSLDLEKTQGMLSKSALTKLQEKQLPEVVQTLIIELIQLDPNKRPKNARTVRKELEQLISDAAIVPVQPDRVLELGEYHSVYEIEELLGKGKEAQVYKAKQGTIQSVALKIFNHDIERERIYSERANIKRVKSPYVVRCGDPAVWSDQRMFLTLDLVKGIPIREIIEKQVQPDLEHFKHVTRCLLEALGCMHRDPDYTEPLLHNDIKPENILLNEQNDPVLIDFGTACTPRVGPYMGTPGYVAPDLIEGVDLDYRESGDLFALGITLFEWLCGQQPYEEIPSIMSTPKTASVLRPDIPPKLNNWLFTAVQPVEDNRFRTVEEMRQAFEDIFVLPKEPEVVRPVHEELRLPSVRVDLKQFGNPYIEYLNTLHNVTAENENALAEAQALSEFFGSIHVPLEITDLVEQYLTSPGKGHVFLTGHAGDGKSTIGLELYKRFKGTPISERLTVPLQEWEQILLGDGRRIHMVKDMSELGGEGVDRLREACRADTATDRWFIISNTGTLLTNLKRLAEVEGLNWLELEDEALSLLERNEPGVLDRLGVPILIINLARIDNLKTAHQLLEKMIADSHWAHCDECDLGKMCPISINIAALRERLEIVTERIEWVYRRLYEYGRRLTMRQIAGHLAYSLTSGLDCRKIQNQAVQPIPPDVTDFLFFNRFFGFAGTRLDQDGQRLTANQYLLPLELGSKPFPCLDRRLWANEEGEKPVVSPSLESILGRLRQMVRYATPSNDISPGRLRQEVRRMVFLFGDMPKDLGEFLSSFLESQMLIQMESWQTEGKIPSVMTANDLTRRVLHVLQEQFTGMPLSEQSEQSDLYVTLKRSDGELRQSVQILMAKIPQTYFALTMEPMTEALKSRRYVLTLTDKISGERLPLELPFLDFVMMRGMGEVGQKLDPGYADRLERFKAGLLRFKNYRQSDGLEVLEFTNRGTFNIRTLLISEKVQVI